MGKPGTRLAALALITVFSATAANAADAELAASGKAFAEVNCAKCHAIGKDGDSKLPIAPPFRTLSSKYPVENLEEALAEGIVTAHPAMPVFKLEPPQISALIAYLNSLGE